MHELITWDWKDPAPVEKILEAYGRVAAQITEVWHVVPEDTGGDFYACIISDHPLDEAEIEDILAGDDEPVRGEWDSPGTSPEDDDGHWAW